MRDNHYARHWFRKPNSALLSASLLLFVLPFQHTTALRLLTLGMAALFTVWTWQSRQTPSIPFKIPLVLWSGVAIFSLIWAVDPAYSLGEIKNEIGYALLTFITFYSLTESNREWRWWNLILLASLVVVSISAFTAYWFVRYDWTHFGLHGGVGDYSTYLITISPFILLAITKHPLSRFPGILVWLTLPLCFLGGYITENRAFWPALGSVMIVFMALRYRRKPSAYEKWKVIGAIIVLGFLIVIPFGHTLKQKVSADGVGQTLVHTAQQDPRSDIWKFAVHRISERPLTGFGFGRGSSRHAFIQQFRYEHAHNVLLDYALQTGLVGVLAFVSLIAAIGREFFNMYRSPDQELSLIGTAGLALLAGIFVKNMTDDFFLRHHALLFWALVGMSLGYGNRYMHRIPLHA